jgi:sarcosine oxidase subunit alpha
MHDWHIKRGAVFEDVGDWKRARYYPQNGETMAQATARECKAVRDFAGAMDATTLGKIDVQGADAAKFLDLIYSNKMSDLRIGRCRYGLMLNEHGMIFDDGVCARLGENHFHLTTTTGGAARVLNWLEEWLQTEWPHLRAHCASVTEQWAVAALAGPKARDILAGIADFPVDKTALPFMGTAAGKVAGMEARVFRVSFSGEAGFEINVPARFGARLWEALFAEDKLTPYGTETMHILRAEKGFIIVGQDTDGSATPDDMGLAWLVAKDKEFLGRRSQTRADTARAGRKQLVGVLTDDEKLVLPEGMHLVNEARPSPPMATQGHITSSYFSASLGRSIALAMIKNGRARLGETLIAPLADGRAARVKISSPVFWDEKGDRLRG